MMRTARHAWWIWGLLVLGSCRGPQAATQGAMADLDLLMQLLTGSFASEVQAAGDEQATTITLHMYPIWPRRGNWLYMEQTRSSHPDQPYRQRIYRLEQVAEGKFRRLVYDLPQPEKYAGAWQAPQRLAQLSPLELKIRAGCDVYLEKTGRRRFEGGTRGRSCASDRRGDSYATSSLIISPDRIVRWVRGFDAQGQQVWGATEGGYVFRRE